MSDDPTVGILKEIRDSVRRIEAHLIGTQSAPALDETSPRRSKKSDEPEAVHEIQNKNQAQPDPTALTPDRL